MFKTIAFLLLLAGQQTGFMRADFNLFFLPAVVPPKPKPCACRVGEYCTCSGDCPCSPSYTDARARSIGQGIPLLVWVGSPAREVAGCVSCRKDDVGFTKGKGVVVAKPIGNDVYHDFTIDGQPTAEEVKNKVFPKKRAESPPPGVFVVPSPFPNQNFKPFYGNPSRNCGRGG